MKWFEHDSNAHANPKLAKLRARHGAAGYGVYWYLVEHAAERLEDYGGMIDPECDVEFIAAELRIVFEECSNILQTLVELPLIRVDSSGRWWIPKLRARADTYAKRCFNNNKLELCDLPVFEECSKSVRRVFGNKTRQEKTEPQESLSSDSPPKSATDRTNGAGRRQLIADFERYWQLVPAKIGRADALKVWLRIAPDPALVETICTAITRQKAARPSDEWQYIPRPPAWLRGQRWEDEPPMTPAQRQRQEREQNLREGERRQRAVRIFAQEGGIRPIDEILGSLTDEYNQPL